LTDEAELYGLVVGIKTAGVARLLAKNLRAPVLAKLGYTESNLRRLGVGEGALTELGFLRPALAGPSPGTTPALPITGTGVVTSTREVSPDQSGGTEVDEGQKSTIQQLVRSGMRAPEIKQKGFTVGHLRKAGVTPVELERCGFQLDELAQWFPPAELRRFGYSARDLRRIFRPQELRSAGFSATDMRNSGASIRELLGWGYSENDVRTAGYSILELQREGLSKQTVDHSKKNR
jgi:intracellular multiplication protein IcmE